MCKQVGAYVKDSTVINSSLTVKGQVYFYYDMNGRPYGLQYNGNIYYYLLNAQGDVIRMLDSTGATVASYEYDPYGNILSATGTMAEANPLRYRGYYYDRETGFYYLNSRYYDPKIGRFINADSYVSTGQGIVGYNMFAYCGNNPVNRSDAEGRFWDTFFDIFSLGVSIYDVFSDPTDGWAWAGLVGDAVDLIPFVTGVGESTKALGVANKVDNVHDAAKAVKNGSKAYAKYDAKQIEKIFDLKKGQFHREIKPDILADLASKDSPYKDLLSKIGKNPDIYLSADGQIQIVSTQYKGKSFITDLYIADFLP